MEEEARENLEEIVKEVEVEEVKEAKVADVEDVEEVEVEEEAEQGTVGTVSSTGDDAHSETPNERQAGRDGDEVAQDINRLVEAMARAARNAWRSDQRRQLEADLKDSLGAMVNKMEEALSRFGQTEQGREFQDQASRVAGRVRESALAADMKEGLSKGLKTAADEVQKFADRLEEEKREPAPPQDMPVDAVDQEEGKNS